MGALEDGTLATALNPSAPYVIVGAQIVATDQVLEHHAVVVTAGRVTQILPEQACDPALPVHRLNGGYLTPGFVDIHVHGAAGASYNEGTAESVTAASRTLLAAGVTTVLPTLASAPMPDILTSLDAMQSVAGASGMPRLPGAHLEGPYFSTAQRGAQSVDDLRLPGDGSAEAILERHAEIRLVSLAPELPGAIDLIQRLVDRGIVAAAGHSDGTVDDLRYAQDAGLSHVIHLYSGQSTTKRKGPWRIPGMLEATLASSDLTVELIADGKHLPPTLMTIAHRALAGRLCLVSDATSGAGMADGSRYTMGSVEYLVHDGVGVTLDHASFGGSTTLLPAMVPIARHSLGLSVPEAIAMVTSIPARAAGLRDVGRIAVDAHADLVHLDEQLHVLAVARDGIWRSAGNIDHD